MMTVTTSSHKDYDTQLFDRCYCTILKNYGWKKWTSQTFTLQQSSPCLDLIEENAYDKHTTNDDYIPQLI